MAALETSVGPSGSSPDMATAQARAVVVWRSEITPNIFWDLHDPRMYGTNGNKKKRDKSRLL